jgi:ATP-dependent Clp protease adaptor protein ClpS
MSTKLTEEAKKDLKTKEPAKYAVILHNDDYTTTDFVISLLLTVFSKNAMEAKDITYRVHLTGYGTAGIYPYEIAAEKLAESQFLAEQNQQPLRLSMEEV